MLLSSVFDFVREQSKVRELVYVSLLIKEFRLSVSDSITEFDPLKSNVRLSVLTWIKCASWLQNQSSSNSCEFSFSVSSWPGPWSPCEWAALFDFGLRAESARETERQGKNWTLIWHVSSVVTFMRNTSLILCKQSETYEISQLLTLLEYLRHRTIEYTTLVSFYLHTQCVMKPTKQPNVGEWATGNCLESIIHAQ